MIDKINTERRGHIMTVEDPIEFVHKHKGCLVNQREVGSDTPSFASALKYVLRQDPDVILVGEMRDLETVQAALTIAETGHLALATLHTNSAAESINRVIDVFPGHQQDQVRAQLAFVLEGVVTQTLVPNASGRGRVVACEIMVATQAVRAQIRDDKIHQIYSAMQSGKKYGMQTLNDSLHSLYMRDQITLQDALRVSGDQAELKRMIGEAEPATVGRGAKPNCFCENNTGIDPNPKELTNASLDLQRAHLERRDQEGRARRRYEGRRPTSSSAAKADSDHRSGEAKVIGLHQFREASQDKRTRDHDAAVRHDGQRWPSSRAGA
jgi:hypothetical protein